MTDDLRCVNAYLDANDTQVVLVCRDGYGRRKEKRVPAEWVTYFRLADLDTDMRRMVSGSVYTASAKKEGDWLRVGWKNRSAREDITRDSRSPLVQAGVPMFEGDVDPVRRLVTDVGLKIGKPRRAYLDLETDSRVPFSKKEEMRVLCQAVVDDAGQSVLGVLAAEDDAAEHELLAQLWEALEPYDQVTAWNGDNFDFPVLFARSEHAGLVVDARQWLWLDHLTLFKRMNMHASESGDEKQSMRLENIAQATVGEGKEPVPDFVRDKFGDKSLGALSWQLWEAGGIYRRVLAKYNLRDTDLLRRIEKETGYIALFETLCEACHLFVDSSALNPTLQVDGFMLSLGREREHHFPSRKFQESIEKFRGAYVMEPRTRGIERDVHVCDFAAMYPSIILSFNMSPDSKRQVPVNGPVPPDRCRAPATGIGFALDVKGILTIAVQELLRLRKHWDALKATLPPGTPEWHHADRMTQAYKVAVNAFYGVIGSPFSRYFDRSVAESVSTTGAWLIEAVIAAAEKKGWRVIYADTDSAFVQGCTKEEFGAFTKQCNEELFPPMLKGQGCVDNFIKLAYEKQFDILVMPTAKRYAGTYVHFKGTAAVPGSKPEIKGLEYKRGDASLLGRRLQGEVIDLLCGGLKLSGDVPVPTQELEHYHAAVSRMRTHVLEEALTNDEVVLSKSLSKPLREYAAKPKKDGTVAAQPPHVQVAHILKERGQEVGEGTRVEYVVTDGAASPMKVIPLEDFTGPELDRFYVWESLVFPPTQRLLQAAFPDHDWDQWAKARPPKPRGKRVKVLEGQAELPSMAPSSMVQVGGRPKTGFRPSVPASPARPFHVRLAEVDVHPEVLVQRLRDVLEAHPGPRPVMVTLLLKNGSEAVLDTPLRVSGDDALLRALAPFRQGAA